MVERTLLLDIETAPNTAYVWGLFDQNISHNQVKLSSYVLCWAAKWLGERKVFYERVTFKDKTVDSESVKSMLTRMHNLLDQAEVVVHYNGRKFDIPTLNKEFIKNGFLPPAPYKQVDVYREVRRTFRFESNKMDAVSAALGFGNKTAHEGFGLWVGCMSGDATAWGTMEKYNKRDVAILEKLYNRLLPWMPTRPHAGMISGSTDACPACGKSGQMQQRGKMISKTAIYQRFQCTACGAWSRARKSNKSHTPSYV